MHPQLEQIIEEFESAERRLHSLIQGTPRELWTKRPEPGRWSMSECVKHLNLTSEAYLPILRDSVDQARKLRASPPRRYRRDFAGWALWKMSGAPVRFSRV